VTDRDDLRCERCGARMAPEQDWCLECGTAARTRLLRPPGFALPIAIVLAVVAVVAVALVLAINAVSDDAQRAVSSSPLTTATAPAKTKTTKRAAPTKTTTTSTVTTATSTSTTPGADAATGADGTVPLWKKSDQGYAVIALTTSDRTEAEAEARKLIKAGEDAGILRSDDYDFFAPGAWVVWVGGFQQKTEAEALNSRLQTGQGGGYVTLVRARSSSSGQ
jgi:cytoskeletal protein RodZ